MVVLPGAGRTCFRTSCNKKKGRQQSSWLGKEEQGLQAWDNVIYQRICAKQTYVKIFKPDQNNIVFINSLLWKKRVIFSLPLRGKIQISFHFRCCPHLHYHRNNDYWFFTDKGWFMNISKRTELLSCLCKNATLSHFTLLFANASFCACSGWK